MKRTKIDMVMGGAGPLRYPIYVGALIAARDKKLIPGKVDYEKMDRAPRLIGTSAGALIGGLYMSGVSIGRIKKLVEDTDQEQFASFGLARFLKAIILYKANWGGAYMNSGKKAEKWLLEQTGGRTMKDCPGLFIVVADVRNGETVILNAASAPDMTVARAIRASISIPLVFDAVPWTDKYGRKRLLMDGGIRYNFPIDYFVDIDKTPVVGFTPKEGTDPLSDNYSTPEIIKMMIQNMIGATEIKSIEDAAWSSWIMLAGKNDDEKSLLSFDADKKTRKKWLEIGRESTYSKIEAAVEDSKRKLEAVSGDSLVNLYAMLSQDSPGT